MATSDSARISRRIDLSPHQPKGLRVEARAEDYPSVRLHWDERSTPVSAHDCRIIGEDLFTAAALAELLQTMLRDRIDIDQAIGLVSQLPRSRPANMLGVPEALWAFPAVAQDDNRVVVIVLSAWGTGKKVALDTAAVRELARRFLRAYEARCEQMPA
jgi:hypothetical protein